MKVWERGREGTKGAVEGECAVSKRPGGVVGGEVDFADVKAREDWQAGWW